MGRSRSGTTSKIHALVDAEGCPVTLRLTDGQMADCTETDALIDNPGESAILLADKGYDSNVIRVRPHNGRLGSTSRRKPTAKGALPSRLGSIGNGTSLRGSSTGSNSFLVSQRDTTNTPPTSGLPSSLSQPPSGARIYESTS